MQGNSMSGPGVETWESSRNTAELYWSWQLDTSSMSAPVAWQKLHNYGVRQLCKLCAQLYQSNIWTLDLWHAGQIVSPLR